MSKMISVASGFQYSVNIGYDLNNETKIKNFIPTASAMDLLEDILLSTQISSTERARVLIGAYGKGKSHIMLMILSLLMKKDLFEQIPQAFGYVNFVEGVADNVRGAKEFFDNALGNLRGYLIYRVKKLFIFGTKHPPVNQMSLMRQQDAVASLSVAGGIILSLESASLNLSRICEWIASTHGKMSITNLEHTFNETFGTRIPASKLAEKLRTSGSWDAVVTDSMDEYIDSLVDAGLSDIDADDLLQEEFF